MAFWNKGLVSFDNLVGNKQAAEAVLSIMYGAARAADNQIGEKEQAKINFAMTKHQLLKDTPKQEHVSFIQNKLAHNFDWDVEDGLAACLKEVADIKSKPMDMKIQIIRAGVIAAKAEDGDLSPPEMAFLIRCCDVAGVSASDVGL